MNNTPLGRAVYYTAPLLLWMLVIFSFSTDAASAERTRPAMNSILRRLLPGLARRLTDAQLERVDWNIRKSAHVTEYAILAILAYRAVAFGNPSFRNRNIVLPFLIGVLYAASDEYHQSFYASRGAKAADVTFDTFGVTLGLLLCLWQHAGRKQR
jgi:VanZ family protein